MNVFVIMPFREPFNGYYQQLYRPTLEQLGYEVVRADDIFNPRPIMLNVQDSILAADMVLCELTDRNPNVLYELGLAHAIGKPAIMVARSEDDIPFDLRHIQFITYDPEQPGWRERLVAGITSSVHALEQSIEVWPPPLQAAEEIGRSSAGGVAEDPREVQRPVNLGFEGPEDNRRPLGWFDSFGHVSGASMEYVTRVVPRDRADGSGSCVVMYHPDPGEGQFGSLMQRCDAPYLAGTTLRFQGELKTEDVEGWAGLWFRIDGGEQPNLFFDNMHRRRLRGATDWQRYAIDVVAPAETRWINYGIVLSGGGKLYADNMSIVRWQPDGTWQEI